MTAKSPVLPVFAGQIDASEILLGLILAVSTFSGMMLKPLFGFLPDRQGRWIWLAVGTMIFAVTPILYLGVESTEALLGLRLFHGMATAIYGPVTLAYVVGLSTQPRAEFFGWFGLSRTAAYILGPLFGGTMLIWVSPAILLAATSAIAILAFIPVLYLGRLEDNVRRSRTRNDRVPVRQLFQAVYSNRPLLSVGLVEMLSRIGVYAVKAFIPLVILEGGGTVMQAGMFLSIQELAVALTRPVARRVADRFDPTPRG